MWRMCVLIWLGFVAASNFHVIDAVTPIEHYLAEFGIFPQLNTTSVTCQSQLSNLDPWALAQMIDASAKIPSGLLALNLFNLGNFRECYDIESSYFDGIVHGKYCLASIAIETEFVQNFVQQQFEKYDLDGLKQSRMLTGNQELLTYRHGFCIPSGCTTEDMNILTQNLLSFMDTLCYSKADPPKLGAGGITALCILALFLGIVIISTIYDLFIFQQNRKPPHDILVAFSALTNGAKLLKSTKDPDQLLCLSGIRSITIAWMMLGHEYLQSLRGPIANYGYVDTFFKDKANMFIFGSPICVDTFFTLAGLVITYTFLKAMDLGVKFNVITFYIHRYIRLTPALAVVVLIHATLLKHLGTGPVWGSLENNLITSCQDYWWSALLYLQNVLHGNDTCVPQSWYLSNDFQLFLLSPLVLVPLKKWPKYGLSFLAILIAAGIAIPIGVTYRYNLVQFYTLTGDLDVINWYYYKQTHTRFGPYVIGMLVGFVIYELRRKQIKLFLGHNNFLRYIIISGIWTVCLAGLLACLYAPHEVFIATEYDVLDNALLNGFLKQSGAVALCGVIFMCVAGYGGPINVFLSLPVFQFLTKLAYSMFLVHFAVISSRYGLSNSEYYVYHSNMMWSFWSDYVLTLLIALLLSLTFESPMTAIERIIFRRKPRVSKRDQI